MEPAASATRLRLHLGARACPGLPCPWDAARELVMYLTKLEFVPTACRLSAEEELTLLSQLAHEPALLAYPPAEHRAAGRALTRGAASTVVAASPRRVTVCTLCLSAL